jgi:hypothetical protein
LDRAVEAMYRARPADDYPEGAAVGTFGLIGKFTGPRVATTRPKATEREQLSCGADSSGNEIGSVSLVKCEASTTRNLCQVPWRRDIFYGSSHFFVFLLNMRLPPHPYQT